MAPVPQRPYGISQANGFQFGYSIPSANSGHGLRGVLPTALSIQPVRWILDPGFNSPCWSDRYDKQNLPGPCGEIIPSMNHITRTDAKLKIGPDGGPLRGPHHQPLRDIHRDMPDQVSSLKEDIWKLSMLQDLYGCSSRDLAMRMIEEISEQAFERRLARYRTKRGKMSNRPLHTNKEVPLEEMKAIDGLTDDQLRFNSCWELSIAMKHHRQPGTDNIYPVPWPAGDFDVVSERMRNAKVALAHWKKAARDGGKPESEWQKEVPKRNRGPRRKSGRSGMATASPETEAS